WITQIGGISKLRSNFAAFGNYTSASHGGASPYLSDQNVNVVLPPSSGFPQLLVGTTGGGVVLIKEDGSVEDLQADQGLRHNWVNGLLRDKQGRIWIGTLAGINCLAYNDGIPGPPSSQTRIVKFNGKGATLARYEKTTIYSCKSLTIPDGTQPGK